MTWLQAREQTLEHWRRIYEQVGIWSLEEFLKTMMEECPMCQKARETAEEQRVNLCFCCPGYQQLGGCQDFMRDLLPAAMKGEWNKVRALVAYAIDYWETVRVPFAEASPSETSYPFAMNVL
jgi:hypothetical protein